MEKIAIHIKNYKNIKNQTFCFNPKFNCYFDEGENKFNFKEKENYINIFPKNINITAIVGKNGTGKSSILKAFLESLEGKDENLNIIYEKEKYISDFMTIYWDYSITDESFINIYPTKNNNMHGTNGRIVFIPSKVDDNFKSKIDIIEDIQNLAKSILSLDNIEEITSEFFKIQKVIIATRTEINNLKPIDLQYFQDYYDHKEKFFCYEVDIKNKNEINELITKDIAFIDFISEDNKKLLDLSFGEIQLLKILYNIQNIITKETECNNNILFLLDEIELGLHPQWQKMIINLLSKMTTKNDKKVYFVLTSHSPFILSDIPKENVIFLDKYKENEDKNQKVGNCKNATKDIDMKTFGANIHTLLSNGFFMSDGLMGEFARNKITEILNFLNDKEELKTIKKDQIKPIIESIGEDFLRNKLLNLYRNKFIKDEKEKEKQILKNKINELQKQYDELNK